jgi:hypothetical protein
MEPYREPIRIEGLRRTWRDWLCGPYGLGALVAFLWFVMNGIAVWRLMLERERRQMEGDSKQSFGTSSYIAATNEAAPVLLFEWKVTPNEHLVFDVFLSVPSIDSLRAVDNWAHWNECAPSAVADEQIDLPAGEYMGWSGSAPGYGVRCKRVNAETANPQRLTDRWHLFALWSMKERDTMGLYLVGPAGAPTGEARLLARFSRP